MQRITASFAALIIAVGLPISAFAYVEYGAYYYTPSYAQMYYQPMYAYAYSPMQNSQQNTYIQYPQQYSYNYNPPSYGSHPQYTYPQYNYPQYSYPQHGYYSQPSPYFYGYPTGDTVPWLGGPMCYFPDYGGRAACGSNPNQWVYDPWTGSWY
ncbi:hypothetical protein A3A38_04175 [Candidatus Kaiserbacteria bacterium RIFCSPLOWO2_01_FULL_53_17]|uniref:Uncharacterized protein n=1 Tax=Candidatus Kaiserbacteria bacterium RIFCSPLOWO2_01_FULL_53_17 TaxID=1798511 RepID=A0A1F6EFW8_9BACT|nr:MAG: hypothetical protein A3A38_04175 [Candidatus Kaiserbacteria bacterium RIFCSPLOWO2_01_FULL_53_17]